MKRVALAIVRLYPRAWRDRYGAEVVDILERRGIRIVDLIDLSGGAFDAWLHPQPIRTLQMATGDPSGAAASLAAASPVPPPPRHGAVAGTPAGLITRRRFLRRMVGAGVGLMSLEFIGGTIAFLWPPPADGVGVEHEVGTLDQIAGLWPQWPDGMPYEFRPARAFLVNVPAATAMASGEAPTATATTAAELLALWRKCPHLGCMIPAACEERGRFQCLCHQSTYNIVGEKLKLGPAPRGMDRFPVRINAEGTVIIDTRTILSGPPTGTVTFTDAYPFDEGCR
jgi:Rieske Fe-S protein